MQIIKQKYITESDCLNNPNSLYLFDDNVLRKGKEEQAQIRDCDNSFGIITKRFPSNYENSFLSDCTKDAFLLKNDLINLIKILDSKQYSILVIPEDGLGMGLAKLPEKAPVLFDYLTKTIEKIIEDYNV
jgi:hypothetical protein